MDSAESSDARGQSIGASRPYEASITLPAHNGSVRRARHFLADQLRTSPTELVETATLLVSELVTNAVRHAHTETEVGLVRHDDVVRIEVADRSAEPATLADRGVTAPGGRGLRIVDALSNAWGVELRQDGKVVWFELARNSRLADDARTMTTSGGVAGRHERDRPSRQRREWRAAQSLRRAPRLAD